jgi:cold shock CspA family protein
MSVRTTLSFQGVDRSPALEQAIAKRVDELAHLHPGLMHVHVAVSELGRHHHQGRHFSVHLDLRCKGDGREFAVTHRHDEDPFVALRGAFDAAKRVLQDDVRRTRGLVKQHPPKREGHVARLDREGGFGFIEDPEGREFYFGRDNLAGGPVFDDLVPGQPVTFIEDYEGDAPQAKRVSVEAAPSKTDHTVGQD